MTNKRFSIIEAPILGQLQFMRSSLISYIEEQNLKGVMRCGVWSFERNVSGGIYYTPHGDAEEESIGIDFMIEINEEITNAEINIYLGWSDGTLIKDYYNKTIKYETISRLAEEFSKLLKNLTGQFLDDMKKEMIIIRNPVYRKH